MLIDFAYLLVYRNQALCKKSIQSGQEHSYDLNFKKHVKF